MAQVNIRSLPDDVYTRLQSAADAEGVSVSEIARRALTAYPASGQPGSSVAAEADQVMIRGGIPKWTRDKVLAVIRR